MKKMKRKTNFKYKSVISGVASGIHPSIVSHFNDNILREMKIIIPNKSMIDEMLTRDLYGFSLYFSWTCDLFLLSLHGWLLFWFLFIINIIIGITTDSLVPRGGWVIYMWDSVQALAVITIRNSDHRDLSIIWQVLKQWNENQRIIDNSPDEP